MTAAVVVFLLGAVVAEGADGVITAVLEEPQCSENAERAIRVLFRKAPNGWVPLDSEEAWKGVRLDGASWTVAFDGRSLGTISSVDPGFHTQYPWTFTRDRLLMIGPRQTAPTLANTDARFAGWCSPPERRPLVLVSQPNFRDPDDWKPFQPADAVRALLFAKFKEEAGPARVCPPDENEPVPLRYEVKDLVFSGSYQDRHGRRIVTVVLNPQLDLCDFEPTSPWQTFLLDDGMRYLGPDLSLVDAGDYDGDGQSELLFWSGGYNEDGYILFYDSLRKHVAYQWKYH